jgi:hypothetical protein
MATPPDVARRSGRIDSAVKLSPRKVLWIIMLPVFLYVLIVALQGA